MQRDLATVILEARRAAGLSQAELARRAGISASYLSRIEGAAWERGGPWPGDSVLRALARALGLSSTDLVAMQQAARTRSAPPPTTGHRARKSGRLPYAVSVGHDEVDRAARDLIGRNPPGGTLRSVHLGAAATDPSYDDALVSAPAGDPRTMLYRVRSPAAASIPSRTAGSPGNVRTRHTSSNPVVLDVLIGDHEVLLAAPDRRGLPYLRAGVLVDDPDFVAALRQWFDESIWDPPASLGAEEHLDPAGAGGIRPSPDADVPEGSGQDVAPVAGGGHPALLEQGCRTRRGRPDVVAPRRPRPATGDAVAGIRVVGEDAGPGHLDGVAGGHAVEAAVAGQRAQALGAAVPVGQWDDLSFDARGPDRA